MQNFVQTGDVLDLDPGVDVPAGVGHLFGSVFGVAAVDAVSGMPSSFVVAGVVDIAKTSALAVDVGDALYWDATAHEVNKTSTDQQQVGIAIAAAANPSATVQMLMRGAPPAAALGAGALDYKEESGGRTLHLHVAAEAGQWGEMGVTDDSDDTPFALLYADDTTGQLSVVSDAAGVTLTANNAGIVELNRTGGIFKMAGFDVAASDATATLTVDAVEYSVAMAIKVRIGADTYFWPLFGPVAP
jgi:predicted RecA/RadA family phage recombinase